MKQFNDPPAVVTVAYVAEYAVKSTFHVGVGWSSGLDVRPAKLGIALFALPESSEV